jgi:hypothetical protein
VTSSLCMSLPVSWFNVARRLWGLANTSAAHTNPSMAQERIRHRVLQSFADGPAGQMLKLAKLVAPLGPGLVVSDDAVADCAARPTETEWARFVDACNLLRTARAESA